MSTPLKSHNTQYNKALITGACEIEGTRLFSDLLNNAATFTMHDNQFSERLGFTLQNLSHLLDAQGLSSQIDQLIYWYGNYYCGQTHLIHPWSVMKTIANYKASGRVEFSPQSGNYHPPQGEGDIGEKNLFKLILKNAKKSTPLAELMNKLFEDPYVNVAVCSRLKCMDQKNIFKNPFRLASLLLMLGFVSYKPSTRETSSRSNLLVDLTIPNQELYLFFSELMKRGPIDRRSQTVVKSLSSRFDSTLIELLKKLFEASETPELFDACMFLAADKPIAREYLSELIGSKQKSDGFLQDLTHTQNKHRLITSEHQSRILLSEQLLLSLSQFLSDKPDLIVKVIYKLLTVYAKHFKYQKLVDTTYLTSKGLFPHVSKLILALQSTIKIQQIEDPTVLCFSLYCLSEYYCYERAELTLH